MDMSAVQQKFIRPGHAFVSYVSSQKLIISNFKIKTSNCRVVI